MNLSILKGDAQHSALAGSVRLELRQYIRFVAHVFGPGSETSAWH